MSSSSTPEPRSAISPEPDSGPHTRDRIVRTAMQLFGRQGFKATTIAQIEAAAGLSPGSGGTYRHFRSKRELLEAGLAAQFAAGSQLLSFIDEPERALGGNLRERLLAVGRAGLRRLHEERDVNRLLLRDLADFPDLLDAFRQHELERVYGVLVGALEREVAAMGGTGPAGGARSVDVPAVAAVLISAVSHYWVLTDVFGTPPLDIDEDRYLRTLADLAATALEAAAG